jgi:hypothetical protein
MQPDMTASVVRLGTDTVVWAATNIDFSANTAVSPWPNTPTDTPYYGFSPLVELIDADASFGVDGAEVPLFSMESSEVPQRNFYRPRSTGDTIIWSAAGLSAELVQLTPHRVDDYDARDTVVVHADGKPGGAIVASFELSKSSLGGNPLYFAVDVLLDPPSAHLTLMIDNGNGKWQYSNATRGLACKRDLGIACTELQSGQRDPAHALDPDKFATRSYQASMQANGTARFGIILTPQSIGSCTATLAGMAIAPIGARWHSLKTDDKSNRWKSDETMAQERAAIDQHRQRLHAVMASPELGHAETVSQLERIKSGLRLAARRSSGGAAGAVLDKSSHPPHVVARIQKSSSGKVRVPAGGIVFAADFADSTGVADASPGLQKAIESLLAGSGPPKTYWGGATDLSGRRLELGGGQYLLQSPLFVPGHFANFQITGGTLRAGGKFPRGKPNFLPNGEPGDSAFLLTLGNETASMKSVDGYIESVLIDEVLFQGAGIAGGGLKVIYGVGLNVGPAVFVDGFTGVGIRVDKGAEVIIHDSWLCGMGNAGHDDNGTFATSVGIQINGNDHYIVDSVIWQVYLRILPSAC